MKIKTSDLVSRPRRCKECIKNAARAHRHELMPSRLWDELRAAIAAAKQITGEKA